MLKFYSALLTLAANRVLPLIQLIFTESLLCARHTVLNTFKLWQNRGKQGRYSACSCWAYILWRKAQRKANSYLNTVSPMRLNRFIMGALNSAYLGQGLPKWNLIFFFLVRQHFSQIQSLMLFVGFSTNNRKMHSKLQKSNLENVGKQFILEGENETLVLMCSLQRIDHRHDTETRATMLNMT